VESSEDKENQPEVSLLKSWLHEPDYFFNEGFVGGSIFLGLPLK